MSVIACFFVCFEFQVFRFVISNFTSIFFSEISFILPPPPQWSLAALADYINKKGGEWPSIWGNIKDLILKTLISVEPTISAQTNLLLQNRCGEGKLLIHATNTTRLNIGKHGEREREGAFS